MKLTTIEQDIDTLLEQWQNGNREHVKKELDILYRAEAMIYIASITAALSPTEAAAFISFIYPYDREFLCKNQRLATK